MATRRKVPERIETHEQAHGAACQLAFAANNMACMSDFLGLLERGETTLSGEMADTLRLVLFDWLQATAEEIEERAERVTVFLEENRKAVA